jgi:N-methylhydantoinase A
MQAERSRCASPPICAISARARSSPCRYTFGYAADGEPVELVNLRLSAIGTAASRIDFGKLTLDSRAMAGASGERAVSFARGQGAIATRLVPRAAVEGGPIAGPAIIESYDTTIVVPPGCVARALGAGTIAIELGDEDA